MYVYMFSVILKQDETPETVYINRRIVLLRVPFEHCTYYICCLQEYSVQLTFREQWLDERLKFNDFGGRLKYLTLTEANRVWMPDLFFSNEKEGHFHNIIMPNVYIRIFPYGSVLYSIR